jgi:hypothetical protein
MLALFIVTKAIGGISASAHLEHWNKVLLVPVIEASRKAKGSHSNTRRLPVSQWPAVASGILCSPPETLVCGGTHNTYFVVPIKELRRRVAEGFVADVGNALKRPYGLATD